MKKSILLFAVIGLLCFLSNISNAQTPDWLWAESAGGTNSDYANAVAADASGNICLAGYFGSPTITFGSDILTNTGMDDVFLVKYDASGNVLWAKSAGGTNSDYANSVAVDASGNIYLAGYFASPTITFGSTTLTNAGSYNIFLAKYDANGNVLWATSAGGTTSDFVNSVAVDTSGNPYVAGWFNSSAIIFGSYTLTNMGAGSSDMFLVKYDASGNVLWANSAGGAEFDFATSVAADISGNTYAAGVFGSSSITFGSYTLTNEGSRDVFLVKYDAGGNVLWAKSAGGTDWDVANSVAVDASGNIYMAGYFFSTTFTFGSDILTNAGEDDVFLAKYDASGNVLWAKSAGGTGSDEASSVAADSFGNIDMTGYFSSSAITFGSYTLTNAAAGDRDIFIANYDATGNVLWAISAGGTTADKGSTLTVDASGNPYVAGYFKSSTIAFGSCNLTNTGPDNTSDMFLAKLESSNMGTVEVNNSFNISVFPNPTFTTITIETPTTGSITIINSSGQQLLRQEITEPTTTIDVRGLKSGVYFVRLTGERTAQVGKFVKQ
jgi:hypothetical protein